MADTEDKTSLTVDDLNFEMQVMDESINNGNNFADKNYEDAIKIIKAFVADPSSIDVDALDKMGEFINFYLGDDMKDGELKELKAEAFRKVESTKEDVLKNKQSQQDTSMATQAEAVADDVVAEKIDPDEAALEQAEAELAKNPETEQELAAFDKENDIDTMTEEQLEVNNKFMDGKEGFNPFTLDEEGKLKHQEFQEEYDAFNNMTVTDDNSNPLSEEEQKKTKDTLLETAMLEAEVFTRGTAKGKDDDLEKQYRSNLKGSMQKAFVSTVFASEIEGKKLSAEQLAESFTRAATQEGGAKAKQSSIVNYAGLVHGQVDKLRDRLKNKFNEIPAVKKISDKISAFDKSMSEKHPKAWEMTKKWGKIVAKAAGRTAVYAAISATAGPVGMGILAVKGGYDAYKNISKQAKAEGKSFREYAKEHKGQVALAFTTSGLAIAGSALGIGVGGAELSQAVAPALKVATKALAVAPKAWDVLKHGTKSLYHRVTGNKEAAKKEWQETLVASERLAEVSIGMILGNEINEQISDHMAQPEAGGNSIDPEKGVYKFINGSEGEDMKLAVDPGKEWQAEQTEMMKPVEFDYERANETQLDRLLDANPRDVNALINDGKWHSSAELHQMMENGELSAEQVKSIHGLANTMFDKEGHITDNNLKYFYEQRAQEAKIEAQRQEDMKLHQESGVDELKSTVKPLEVENPEPIEIKTPEVKAPNGTLEARMDVDGDGKVDDVTIINQDGQRVVATEFGGKGGRAEVTITDEDGNSVKVNNETLREAGATKGEARRTMDNIVDQAKAGQYNTTNLDDMKDTKGFEYTAAPAPEAPTVEQTTLESQETVQQPAQQQEQGFDNTPAEIKYPEGTNLTVVNEEVTEDGLKIVTSEDKEHGLTVVQYNDEKGHTLETSVTEIDENGNATRTRYDWANNVSCVEVQDKEGVWVDASEAQQEQPTTEENLSQTVEAEQVQEAPVTNSDPVYYNEEAQEEVQQPVQQQVEGGKTEEQENKVFHEYQMEYHGEYNEMLRDGMKTYKDTQTGEYVIRNGNGEEISRSSIHQVANSKANIVITNTGASEVHYQELLAKDPDTLDEGEKMFMEQHDKQMTEKWGMQRGEDGKLFDPDKVEHQQKVETIETKPTSAQQQEATINGENLSQTVEAEQVQEAPVTNSDPVYYNEDSQAVEAEQVQEAPVTNSDPVYYNEEAQEEVQQPVQQQEQTINIVSEENENGSEFRATIQGDGASIQEQKQELTEGIRITRDVETGKYIARNIEGEILVEGSSYNAVNLAVDGRATSIAQNEILYDVLADRDPETLNDAERNFMQQHDKRAKEWFGYERGEDGKLVRPETQEEIQTRKELGLQDGDKVSVTHNDDRGSYPGSEKVTTVTKEDGSFMEIKDVDIDRDGKTDVTTVREGDSADEITKVTTKSGNESTVTEKTDEGIVRTEYNAKGLVTEVGIDNDGDGRDDAIGTVGKNGNVTSVSHLDDKGNVVQKDFLNKDGEITQTKVADENGNMQVQKPGETNEHSESRKSMVDKIRNLQGLGGNEDKSSTSSGTANSNANASGTKLPIVKGKEMD